VSDDFAIETCCCSYCRAARRDTERIRRELLDRLDAGGPEFADAVARNLTINAAASLLDAIAEAILEETR
jgi:hypothetical protein